MRIGQIRSSSRLWLYTINLTFSINEDFPDGHVQPTHDSQLSAVPVIVS